MPHYLTREGLAELQAEYDLIVKVKLPEALELLNRARAEGDLRENAGYDAAKEERAKLEARIAEIEEILHDYELIEDKAKTTATSKASKRVEIGGTVIIQYLHDNTKFELKIVGSSEADAINSKISNESPLAKAILGKKEGDEASFKVKNNVIKVKIIEILA
jgi:transcription elongation factor GreA